MIFLLLLIACAPCLFLLWYFYHRDKYEREPKRKLLTVYLAGALMTIPVAVLEMLLIQGLNQVTTGILHTFIMSFVIIAPIEELAKFVVVKRWVYKWIEFDEVMDGIVYTVAASLGFATVENIFYVLTQGIQIGIARAFLAVPGHAFFGALMGYYIGLAKFNKKKEAQLITKGIVLAIITHGLYDFLILARTVFAAFAVILIIILGLWVRRELKKAEMLSARKLQEPEEIQSPGEITKTSS